MANPFSVAIAQVNLLVGDFRANVATVLDSVRRARDELGCRAIVFPELTLTGYPPEDLLLRDAFIVASERALGEVTGAVRGCAVAARRHPRPAGTRCGRGAGLGERSRRDSRPALHFLS